MMPSTSSCIVSILFVCFFNRINNDKNYKIYNWKPKHIYTYVSISAKLLFTLLLYIPFGTIF